MGKYSSDSDSEKRGSKSSYKSRPKHRSSSSSSSDSRSRRRKRKSRSRERYSKSKRSRSHSSGSVAHKSKSRRRSRSKDRFRHKRSRSRDRHHRSRSRSKNRHRRSRSRSYIREYTSKPRRHSSSSSSSLEPLESNLDENSKSEPARRSPEVSRVDVKVLNAINEDGFVPKQFSSKSKKMMENIVIDLKKQTIKVPEVEPVEPDSIFHHNLFLNEEARMEKWIKELYGYRQRALQQGLKNTEKVV